MEIKKNRILVVFCTIFFVLFCFNVKNTFSAETYVFGQPYYSGSNVSIATFPDIRITPDETITFDQIRLDFNNGSSTDPIINYYLLLKDSSCNVIATSSQWQALKGPDNNDHYFETEINFSEQTLIASTTYYLHFAPQNVNPTTIKYNKLSVVALNPIWQNEFAINANNCGGDYAVYQPKIKFYINVACPDCPECETCTGSSTLVHFNFDNATTTDISRIVATSKTYTDDTGTPTSIMVSTFDIPINLFYYIFMIMIMLVITIFLYFKIKKHGKD